MLTKLFRKPSASERAAQELHAAKLDRLQAQAAEEYWRHQCAMLDERVVRLEYAADETFMRALDCMPRAKPPRRNPTQPSAAPGAE